MWMKIQHNVALHYIRAVRTSGGRPGRRGYRRLSNVSLRSQTATRRVGLPRKAERIFDVVLRQLAEHGYDALTIEGIADEAGVNKTTLYRWWSGKDDLLSATLRHAGLFRVVQAPDTGTLRGDILELLRQIGKRIGSPHGRAVLSHVIGGGQPQLAQLATEFVDDRLPIHQQILARAAARGEIAPVPPDIPSPLHPLVGALWLRILMLRQPADEAYLAEIVDTFLTGFLNTMKPA